MSEARALAMAGKSSALHAVPQTPTAAAAMTMPSRVARTTETGWPATASRLPRWGVPVAAAHISPAVVAYDAADPPVRPQDGQVEHEHGD